MSMLRHSLGVLLLGVFLAGMFAGPAQGMERLSDSTIDNAVKYGLENQEMGLSLFMGGNWREGSDGALLNIYTPYMELARSASHRGMPVNGSLENVVATRKKMVEDIDYIWHHPTVKFMVSLFGETPGFASQYYAQIEGVGNGRTVTLYPHQAMRQLSAQKEPDSPVRPYAAINAYHFRYEDLVGLDELTLKLYGKGVEPMKFRILTQDFK